MKTSNTLNKSNMSAITLQALQCPITHDIMVDPVKAPDGHTYERAAVKIYDGVTESLKLVVLSDIIHQLESIIAQLCTQSGAIC